MRLPSAKCGWPFCQYVVRFVCETPFPWRVFLWFLLTNLVHTAKRRVQGKHTSTLLPSDAPIFACKHTHVRMCTYACDQINNHSQSLPCVKYHCRTFLKCPCWHLFAFSMAQQSAGSCTDTKANKWYMHTHIRKDANPYIMWQVMAQSLRLHEYKSQIK